METGDALNEHPASATKRSRGMLGMVCVGVLAVLIASPAWAGDAERGADKEQPNKYASRRAAIRSPVAVSPSLYLDSALSLAGGAAVLAKVAGACDIMCFGVFAFIEGEVGLDGYQIRSGLAASMIGDEFVPHVWFNIAGISAAAAYLNRAATNESRQTHREDYLGATLTLGLLRIGLFGEMKTGGFLSTAALGFGF